MAEAITLELSQVEVRGSSGSPLELSSSARRVGLVGDWAPLFRAFLQRDTALRGALRVLGVEPNQALSEGRVGLALNDPTLPSAVSVRDYLAIAARLRHGSPSRAATETQRVLDRFGLNGIATQRLDRLQHFQRRALGVALASLGEPELCVLEAPLRGLDAQAADFVGRLVAELGRHCRVLVSSEVPTTPSPERTLLDGCDELFVLLGGELVAQGAPSRVFGPNERYLLTVAGARVNELAEALRAAGCELSARGRAGSFSVTLPERATSDLLLDCALDAGVVVHELEPLLVTHSSVGSGLAAP